MRLAIVLVLACAGCPATQPSEGLSTIAPAQRFDYDDFVCDALPVLVRRCSYLACHGDAQHAFRVYSPSKLRLQPAPTRSDRDAALTQAEVELNFESAVGVMLASAPSNGQTIDAQHAPLLQKPLRAAFGGGEHQGIGIFPVPPAKALDDDPDWLALVKWAGGAKQPTPPTADCQAFFASLGLVPK